MLGGAWVRTQIGPNMVVFEGRTFGADLDAAVLGLDGDPGADAGFTTPAGWPNGVGPSDLVLGVLPAALRDIRTTVTVQPISDSLVAKGTAGCTFDVVAGLAPWQKTITIHGTPVAPVNVRVEVQYHHSGTR